MVRFLVLYSRPTDVEAFERHYRSVHAPLVKKVPGLLRYTVSRNVSPFRDDEPFYMVAELDWSDLAALQQGFASDEGRATSRDMAENLAPLTPGTRRMIYEVEEL